MDPTYLHFTNSLGRRYCVVRYIKSNQLLNLIWQGTASEESIKEVREGVLQLLRSYPCTAILDDTQKLFHGPSAILFELTEADWNFKVADLGVARIAHVLNPNAEVPGVIPAKHGYPEVGYFTHHMDALEWLNRKSA